MKHKLFILVAGLFFGNTVFGYTNIVLTPPANGANAQPLFEQAIATVVEGGFGMIEVRGGDYYFDSAVTADLEDAQVSIVGAGKGVTRLHNRDSLWGIFKFENSTNSSELDICELTFTAAQTNSGIAVKMTNPSLCENAGVCNLLIQNVTFIVENWDDYSFSFGVIGEFLQSPVFSDVILCGPRSGSNTQVGFKLISCANPSFENSYSKCVDKSFWVSDVGGTVLFDRCNPVNADLGFYVGANSNGCDLVFLNCHSNVREENLIVDSADSVRIENWLSYCPSNVITVTSGDMFRDCKLIDCADVDIRGNIFHQSYSTNRTLITLVGSTRDVLIDQNIFNVTGAEVLSVGPSVENVSCGLNITNAVTIR